MSDSGSVGTPRSHITATKVPSLLVDLSSKRNGACLLFLSLRKTVRHRFLLSVPCLLRKKCCGKTPCDSDSQTSPNTLDEDDTTEDGNTEISVSDLLLIMSFLHFLHFDQQYTFLWSPSVSSLLSLASSIRHNTLTSHFCHCLILSFSEQLAPASHPFVIS